MAVAVFVLMVLVPSAGLIVPMPVLAMVRSAVSCAKFAVTVPFELSDTVVVGLEGDVTSAPPETVHPVKW